MPEYRIVPPETLARVTADFQRCHKNAVPTYDIDDFDDTDPGDVARALALPMLSRAWADNLHQAEIEVDDFADSGDFRAGAQVFESRLYEPWARLGELAYPATPNAFDGLLGKLLDIEAYLQTADIGAWHAVALFVDAYALAENEHYYPRPDQRTIDADGNVFYQFVPGEGELRPLLFPWSGEACTHEKLQLWESVMPPEYLQVIFDLIRESN